MYKPITTDEYIAIFLMISLAVVHRILDGAFKTGSSVIFIAYMAIVGYLCFNRQVKFLWRCISKRKNYYPTVGVIGEINSIPVSFGAVHGKYPSYVVSYLNESNEKCVEEIHNFFSVRSIKAGQKIKLRINRENTDDMIVLPSDIFLFVLLCIMGILFETGLLALYIHVY